MIAFVQILGVNFNILGLYRQYRKSNCYCEWPHRQQHCYRPMIRHRSIASSTTLCYHSAHVWTNGKTADAAHTHTSFCVYGDPFYRAMLCIRGTSHGHVSVCLSVRLSVTSRCSTKTAKRRITQTTPHDSPGTLVFWSQRSPRNSTAVTPYEGAECRWGGSKSATFVE